MCYWRRLSKRSTNETEFDSDDNYDQNDSDSQEFVTSTTAVPDLTISNNHARQRSPGSASIAPDGTKRQSRKLDTSLTAKNKAKKAADDLISERLSLFQALEVLEDRGQLEAASNRAYPSYASNSSDDTNNSMMCYQRAEVFAFLFTTASVLLAAISITIGCCWRASLATSRRAQERKKLYYMGAIL